MPSLPFQTIKELDWPITEIVGGRIGCIHDAFLTFAYEVCETLPQDDRDLVLLVGKGKQHIRLREIAERAGRAVVVFAPGDGPLLPTYMPGRSGLPTNVVAAFASNNQMVDPRAVSVPIGVRTSKLPQLQFVRQNRPRGHKRLAYANFAVSSSPDVRARLVELLRGSPWVTFDISDDHRSDPEQLVRYYSEIAGHKFALSPEGNGIDCYRTWEILYLGAIPIVMASQPMSAFSDLPILFTEDYSELTEEYLEQRWQEMASRSYEIDRMLKSWYMNRFLEAVSTLDRPRFVCWRVDGSPFDRALRALARSSRSVSGLVIETPTPPFTGRRSFTEPDHWNVGDGLELKRNGMGLEIRVRGQGRRVLELPLETIAGAPFCLTGRVRRGSDDPLALMVDVRERSKSLASTEVAGEEQADLCLNFVARSSRTLLSLSVPVEAAGGCAVVSDLVLSTTI